MFTLERINGELLTWVLTIPTNVQISCLAAGLYHTACPSTTNETCLCIDQTYTDYVTDCVKSSCSIRESLCTF